MSGSNGMTNGASNGDVSGTAGGAQIVTNWGLMSVDRARVHRSQYLCNHYFIQGPEGHPLALVVGYLVSYADPGSSTDSDDSHDNTFVWAFSRGRRVVIAIAPEVTNMLELMTLGRPWDAQNETFEFSGLFHGLQSPEVWNMVEKILRVRIPARGNTTTSS